MILRHVQQPHGVGVNTVEHRETSCEIPNKPKNKKKNECVICRNGRRNSLIILRAKKLLSQVKHPEAFLVDRILRNLQEQWYRASTGFSLTSRRTEIAQHGGSKFQGALCRRRIGSQVLRADKFGDWMTAGHKVLTED